jgi:hypothetical protein
MEAARNPCSTPGGRPPPERGADARAVAAARGRGVRVALGLAVALLQTCATIALLVPVRRARRIDPGVILR